MLLLVVAGLAAVAVLVGQVVAFAQYFDERKPVRDASDDVTIRTCGTRTTPDPAVGRAVATLEVRNGGTELARYHVTVAFTSPDHPTSFGVALVWPAEVEPGASAELSTLLGPDVPVGARLECTVTQALRTVA